MKSRASDVARPDAKHAHGGVRTPPGPDGMGRALYPRNSEGKKREC